MKINIHAMNNLKFYHEKPFKIFFLLSAKTYVLITLKMRLVIKSQGHLSGNRVVKNTCFIEINRVSPKEEN